MGLFDRFTAISAEDVLREHGQWLALADREDIEFSAVTIHDLLIFTSKRVIITDTQHGLFSKKTEYQSLPYRSISRWSVESKGGWLGDADLKLWISSQVEPTVSLQLGKDESAKHIATVLATLAL